MQIGSVASTYLCQDSTDCSELTKVLCHGTSARCGPDFWKIMHLMQFKLSSVLPWDLQYGIAP